MEFYHFNSFLSFLLLFFHISCAPDPPHGWTNSFDKITENKKCTENILTQGSCSGARECKERCIATQSCKFYSFGAQGKRKWCETYEICYYRNMVGSEGMNIYARLTACEFELRKSGPLNAAVRISNEIKPTGIIKSDYPGKNLVCTCTGLTWMICVVIVKPGSPEDKSVRMKFELTATKQFAAEPFYIITTRPKDKSLIDVPTMAAVCYDLTVDEDEDIYAEMQVITPQFCVDIRICVNRICPVTKMTIESDDAVFIMNEDVDNVRQGLAVNCISFPGMRAVKNIAGVYDPFGRKQGTALSETEDYSLYLVFREEELQKGICQDNFRALDGSASSSMDGADLNASTEGDDKKKRKRKKKKAGAGNSSTEDERPPMNFEGQSKTRIDATPEALSFEYNIAPGSIAEQTNQIPLQTARLRKLSLPMTPEERFQRKELRKKVFPVPNDFLASDEENPKAEEEIQMFNFSHKLHSTKLFTFSTIILIILISLLLTSGRKTTSSGDTYVILLPESCESSL